MQQANEGQWDAKDTDDGTFKLFQQKGLPCNVLCMRDNGWIHGDTTTATLDHGPFPASAYHWCLSLLHLSPLPFKATCYFSLVFLHLFLSTTAPAFCLLLPCPTAARMLHSFTDWLSTLALKVSVV